MRARAALAFVLLLVATAGCRATGSGSASDPTVPPDPEAPAEPEDAGPEDAAPAARGPLEGRRICLDPGHDDHYSLGSSGYDSRGRLAVHPTLKVPLTEPAMTLVVADRLRTLLEADGAAVCVTRRDDGGLQVEPYDFTGDGRVRTEGQALEDTAERLQPRIDWANAFDADVLVSIHFNGNDDPTVRGTEAYYSDDVPSASDGRALGEALVAATLDELRARGLRAVDRGTHDDIFGRYDPSVRSRSLRHNAAAITANGHDPATCEDCRRLVILGNNPTSIHMGTYLGVLVELEYLSSRDVVQEVMLRDDVAELFATALRNGLVAWFAGR
jgi:N-acetylmuramoyl-L-alanine amidase